MGTETGNVGLEYLAAAEVIVHRVRETQMEAIAEAARICADSIAARGLVHLFGTGHSRIAVEEIFPRHGSFPGFHPIIELSLTYHNQVVGRTGSARPCFSRNWKGSGRSSCETFSLGRTTASSSSPTAA